MNLDSEDPDRLKSGKAVASALILAGIVVAAVVLFLIVAIGRGCAAH